MLRSSWYTALVNVPPLTGACGPVFPPSCVTVNELESSVNHFTENHQKMTLSENGFLFC